MSAQRMSNADAAWLHMDRPTNLMVVNALLWFEEPVDAGRVREILRSRLVEPFPRFRQMVMEPRLGVGVPSWQDDRRFDLDRHVHHLAVPAPGDKRALEALVSDLVVSPLDRSKPLWDMYLIDGFGAGMAMLSRTHHCIADGIALSRVLLSLTDAHPDAGIAPARERTGRGVLGSIAAPVKAGGQVARAGVHEGIEILTHPSAELPALASRGTADAATLAKLLLTGSDAKTVLSAKLSVSRHVTWSERMPLDGIKAIGHATGTTVNDVLTTAMTGALHGYLLGRDSLVDEIRVMVPYNLRAPDDPLPRELGNRFGLVYLTLPVGITDPADRLAEVHRRMDAIKHSREGGLSYAILEAVGLTPHQIEQSLLDVFAQKTTAVLTNVAGPAEPVYFAGSKIAGVVPWVPAAGTIGMGINIFSYDGGVTVGLQVDAGLIPDPDTIIADYEREVDTLRKLAPRRRTQKAARR
ncbi:MAG TPA: wax ester/triacylglycerol synthase family O-acyltransferase [Solirubrobacteraceae bacterium]|nr:wax ester/triacylglycerol synthase family O-acyltransferase [Solirubrobacteraceae bacterium]